jgi:hypothetical protein
MSPQEKSQLEKWADAKARIRASFMGGGSICMLVEGRISISLGKNLELRDDAGVLRLFVPLSSLTPDERVEPLIDLPEDLRWRVGFLVAQSFRLRSGHIDLLEIEEPEIDTTSPMR